MVSIEDGEGSGIGFNVGSISEMIADGDEFILYCLRVVSSIGVIGCNFYFVLFFMLSRLY